MGRAGFGLRWQVDPSAEGGVLGGGTSLSFLVLVTGCTSVGRIPDAEIYKITATDFYPLQEEAKEEDRLAALRLKKLKKKKKKNKVRNYIIIVLELSYRGC